MNALRRHSWKRGVFATEAMVALGILTVVALPLAYSSLQAPRQVSADYRRTVLLELLDGEAEILAAGAARSVPDGSFPWIISAASTTNLPPGRFLLTRRGSEARLEWQPEHTRWGRPVVREFRIAEPLSKERFP